VILGRGSVLVDMPIDCGMFPPRLFVLFASVLIYTCANINVHV